jgi:hypothetical protein
MKRKILERLSIYRVFKVEVFEDQINLVEACDNNFDLTLYKKDLADLIKELQDIHDNLI